jgi:hypothetical protein
VSTVIINGEYAHHRCDCCGVKAKGTPWTTHGPGFDARSTWSQDSSTPPTGWSKFDLPYKHGSVTRHDRCPDCTKIGTTTVKDSEPT